MSWFRMYRISLRFAWAGLLDALCYACDRRIGHVGHVYKVTCDIIRQPNSGWLEYGNKLYATHKNLHKM